MRVGTDGTLLGAWADGGKNILDIGTGTGLIALMMCQRFHSAKLTAIDIDAECCHTARLNAEHSPFSDRIIVMQADINDFALTSSRKFDVIVVNPPYFVDALKSPTRNRSMARHADSMPFDMLFSAADRLMTVDGLFSAIIPAVSMPQFTTEASLHGLSLSRRTDIKTVYGKPVSRHLLEFRRSVTTTNIQTVCLHNDDGTESYWYRELTKDFYLKF